MSRFWAAVGAYTLALLCASPDKDEEEQDDMARHRHKKRKADKESGKIRLKEKRSLRKEKNKQHLYATLFYTAGVKNVASKEPVDTEA